MATSLRNPDQILSFPSTIAAATPEGALVVVDTTADDTVTLPGGASPTTPVFGLLYQPSHPTTANLPVQVVMSGVFPGIAGASITRGAELTAHATAGRVQTAAPSAGTNVGIIGIALESASAGERVAILIRQYVKQG